MNLQEKKLYGGEATNATSRLVKHVAGKKGSEVVELIKLATLISQLGGEIKKLEKEIEVTTNIKQKNELIVVYNKAIEELGKAHELQAQKTKKEWNHVLPKKMGLLPEERVEVKPITLKEPVEQPESKGETPTEQNESITNIMEEPLIVNQITSYAKLIESYRNKGGNPDFFIEKLNQINTDVSGYIDWEIENNTEQVLKYSQNKNSILENLYGESLERWKTLKEKYEKLNGKTNTVQSNINIIEEKITTSKDIGAEPIVASDEIVQENLKGKEEVVKQIEPQPTTVVKEEDIVEAGSKEAVPLNEDELMKQLAVQMEMMLELDRKIAEIKQENLEIEKFIAEQEKIEGEKILAEEWAKLKTELKKIKKMGVKKNDIRLQKYDKKLIEEVYGKGK